MYIKITDKNNMSNKEIEELLKSKGIEFDTYLTPLSIFYNEEADFRIDLNFDDEYSEEELDKIKESCVDDIADRFMDSEYIIDGDLLDEITREVVEDYIG